MQYVAEGAKKLSALDAVTFQALLAGSKRAKHTDILPMVCRDDIFAYPQLGQCFELKVIERSSRYAFTRKLAHARQVIEHIDAGLVESEQAHQF
jgi:hypothetical protein